MKPIPVQNRVTTQPFVVGGCIIRKDDKFLLVQEAVVDRGSWNHPAGWIDLYEKIVDGAKREAQEETGLEIKIIGFLGAYSLIKKSKRTGNIHHPIKFIFAAEPITEEFKFDPKEIMDAKWFTIDDIKELKEQGVLRDHDIINEVQDYIDGKIFPLEIVDKNYEQIEY
jgi:ADP-ribose pyrophosphatase YjhB (NUDIX family)